MTKVNMTGWTQEEIDNWQDPMTMGMQPKQDDINNTHLYQQIQQTGLGGLLQLPFPPSRPKILEEGTKFPYEQHPIRFPHKPYPPDFMPMPGPRPMPIKEVPNYEDQFNSFSETLGGFGKQMGGFGEQFGGIMDRLTKIEEGIAGLMPQGAGAGGGTVPYGNSPTTPTTPSSPLDGGVFSVYSGQNARGY